MSQDPSTSGDENPGVVSYLFGPRLTSMLAFLPSSSRSLWSCPSFQLMQSVDWLWRFVSYIHLPFMFSLSFPSHLLLHTFSRRAALITVALFHSFWPIFNSNAPSDQRILYPLTIDQRTSVATHLHPWLASWINFATLCDNPLNKSYLIFRHLISHESDRRASFYSVRPSMGLG